MYTSKFLLTIVSLFSVCFFSCNIEEIELFEPAGSKRINTNDGVFRIPVVVHVIHNGEAIGEGANISAAQVKSQIDVLNEDFRRKLNTNGYNENPNGADCEIEFYLATTGPDGVLLSEAGIHRVDGRRKIWPKGFFIRNPIETVLKPTTIWTLQRILIFGPLTLEVLSGAIYWDMLNFPQIQA